MMLRYKQKGHRRFSMSNMKSEWEDAVERDYRQAGLTKETMERINKWITKQSKQNAGCCGEGCGCSDVQSK